MIFTAWSRWGRIASSRALRSLTQAAPCPPRDSIRSPCIFFGTLMPSVWSTVAEMSVAAMYPSRRVVPERITPLPAMPGPTAPV